MVRIAVASKSAASKKIDSKKKPQKDEIQSKPPSKQHVLSVEAKLNTVESLFGAAEDADGSDKKKGTRALLNVLGARTNKKNGEKTTRESLSALYAIAHRLHSKQLPFYSKTLETRESHSISTEQIWGQLTMLLKPVLRRLEENVRKFQKDFGNMPSKSAHKKAPSNDAKGALQRKKDPKEEDAEDDMDELRSPSSDRENSTRDSELNESDLDEEIAALLKQKEDRKKNKQPSESTSAASKGGDAWRYAFGKDGAGDDDGDDDAWAEGEDRDDSAKRGRSRVMGKREDYNHDKDNDDDDDDDDAADELAALKELYGEDYEPDGHRLGRSIDDDDPEMEEDIELDDPQREFTEKDGQYFGKDDILNDETGEFAADGDAEEDGEVDEELERALSNPNLTLLERERLREKYLIEKLEKKRLYQTDWALAGETAASKRPRDALLSTEDIEFDYGMKSVPVITEAVTAKLEERIKKRILEKQFDDVARKTTISTPADLASTKRDPALDSQKSKLSLMDIYEKEYLEKAKLAEEANGEVATAEPLTEIEKDELRAVQMWKRLAQHLDALSNFYYTPKPVQQDLEARVRATNNSAPAITLESVGNFATTRESALAPQDIYRASDRKLAGVGSNEMTPQERRALRRSKKDQKKTTQTILSKRKEELAKAKK